MRKTLLAAACAALLLLPASIAQGAELLYWNNFDDDTVAFADIGGGGGGPLSLGEVKIDGPEGLAFDSATGRLFVASEDGGVTDDGQIVTVNVDGSGAAVFSAPGAPVDGPHGIAIDPVARLAYWINSGAESISWARLDGSAGGTLNTTGATVERPFRIGFDPVAGRIYWVNAGEEGDDSISFANVNNSGGGDLNLDGATRTEGMRALTVDPAGGRIYWIVSEEGISFANLNGSGGGDLNLGGADFIEPFGLAFDPSIGRFYWGSVSNGRTGTFSFANLAGGEGGIDVATAPVAEAQDPVILKSPSGTAVPAIARAAELRTALSCSQGTWAPDFAGSNVYRAPNRFAYQWLRDGQPVPGATASKFTATDPGSYTCAVTASNQAGSATQTSAATALTGVTLKLTVKRKVKAKPGKVARLKLTIENLGDLVSRSDRLCVKVGKQGKALKAPRCKLLGVIPGGATRTDTVGLRVRAGASGTYRVKLIVKGAPAQAVTAKILVR
ncbi:MAG TPA: hypothetical protein VFX45_11805 [Solirubrobacterales bacterium]|nr:hypothetical protein [Solirubrobacterales bacterium]